MTKIKTVILSGGQGTRIRDVADDVPKPLIRIGDRPIVWHVMNIYAKYDITDFVLCLGYKGWLLKEFFLNYNQYVSDFTLTLGQQSKIEYHNEPPEREWRVTLAETGLKTQTGGRISRIRQYVQDADLICVTYGDGLANVNIDALIEFHKAHGRVGTVTGVRPQERFGTLEVEQAGSTPIISNFSEKPQSRGLINGGFFVFDQRLFDYVNDDEDLIFERDPLKKMSQDGQLAVYEHNGFWQPMDTYREWKLLNSLWENQDIRWLDSHS